MRPILFAASFAVTAGSAFGGEGMVCDKVEYAKLKDSTRAELTQMYCSGVQKAKLNADLREIQKDSFDKLVKINPGSRSTDDAMKSMQSYGAAQVTCVGFQEDAMGMLTKKFKASKAPACG